MENINDIILNEFCVCGYNKIADIDGRSFMSATFGTDYWLVSSNIDDVADIDKQLQLYNKVIEQTTECKFVEKNLSLLLLVNLDKKNNVDTDFVQVENDKFYFKKYVLKYNQESVTGLIEMMTQNHVQNICPLLLDDSIFEQFRETANTLSAISLLYSIAHKLTFIPIPSSSKPREDTKLNLDSFELQNLLDWVKNSPSTDTDIDTYLNNLIAENEEV